MSEAVVNGISEVGPCGVRERGFPSQRQWKQRCSSDGLLLFDRASGLNVLLDEVPVPPHFWSRAPRQVSIALHNHCDLACPHCYAPKSGKALPSDTIARWLGELDAEGALGVGFGGGEPTLYRNFVSLCRYAARETRLSVSFTTHGHHIDEAIAEELRGSVNFIRVSMDGVGATYEAIRGRSFRFLQTRLKFVRSISRFGINIVVNERTLPDLDEAATAAADAGACEFLLLPEVPVRGRPGLPDHALEALRRWVETYRGPLTLSISQAWADGFRACDPLAGERGLRAYAHIDAAGLLKPTSYHATGVPIGEAGVIAALNHLSSLVNSRRTTYEDLAPARVRTLGQLGDDRPLRGCD